MQMNTTTLKSTIDFIVEFSVPVIVGATVGFAVVALMHAITGPQRPILPENNPYTISEQHLGEFNARKEFYRHHCPTRTMRATASCDRIFAWMMQASNLKNNFPFTPNNPIK